MPRDAGDSRSHRLSGPAPLREALAGLLLGLLATSPLWAMDWLAERQQEVERMTPAEKEDLNEKCQKFAALSTDQQDQLRQLHQQLEIDPNGERLRRVMQRYYDWLKTLTPGERADLLSLPLADRTAKIKTLKQDQEAWAAKLSGGSHLTLHDVQVLSDWVKKYSAAHEAELAKDIPPRRHGPGFGQGPNSGGSQPFPVMDQAAHDRMVLNSAWRHWSGDKLPTVSQTEIDDLANQLSTKPRGELESQHTLHDKAEIVHKWLQAIGRTRFSSGFGKQGGNVNRKELAKFFEHLPKDEQDKLIRITDKEEQNRELRKLYFQYRRAQGFSAGAGGDGEPHFNHLGPPPTAGSKASDSPAGKSADSQKQ